MALRDPQSAAIRTVGQARPFFVAYDLSDHPPGNAWCRTIARSDGIVLQCHSKRLCFPWSAEGYPSVRIRWHAFGVPLIDSRVASRLVFWLVLRLEFNSNACAPLRPHSHLSQARTCSIGRSATRTSNPITP